MQLTQMQKQAVELEGNSILVSAAAGSGKTSVLSLRVIRKLTDPKNPCDANRLMILTFTTAAAAEMRERITSQLRALAASDPKNTLVRRQLLLLAGAKICTIHSACLDIVRSNFQHLDIDPQFTIAEENRLSLIKTEALDEFTEAVYDRVKNDERVGALIEYFTRGRDDSALVTAIDTASEFLSGLPYPEQFIAEYCKQVPDNVFDILKDCALQNYLSKALSAVVANYKKLAGSVMHYPKLADFYQAEGDDIALILKFINEKDFDKAFFAAKDLKFKTHPRKPKDSLDWDSFSNYRKALKKRTGEIIDRFLYADSKTVLSDRAGELEILNTLLNLSNEFNRILFEKRKKQRLMSFDDIEKYTLKLLINNEDGVFTKTELARELSDNIDEIIVDEYQDCNLTQNLIFTALSKDSKNIFAVGDVKQSIYRFRGAQPDIFIKKQKESLAVTDGKALDRPMRVDLSCNFRSDKKILDFVNKVFDTLMTEDRGGISYTDGHRLTQVSEKPEDKNAGVFMEVVIADSVGNKAGKALIEAQHVAKRIHSLVASGELITDIKTGVPRPIRYDDISILMRAPKTDGAIFEQALKSLGIGCINNNPSENYLDTSEVRNILAFLQVIDNPYEDIPLVTLMYSELFGFSANELAQIRAKNRYGLFFDAVKDYAKTDAKTQSFTDTVEYLRNLSMTTDVYGIISAVYEKSGILLRLSSKPEGDSAKANLMMLLDYASKFESSRYRGLFAFINYIGKLIEKKDSIPAARLKKSGDCVSILSIHGSKGLEYPVVFVVGTANSLNTVNKKEIIFNSDLGVGGHTRDNVRHRAFSSLSRNLISAYESMSELHEELRLLYVALTRAKNRLYLTACVNVGELEKTVNEVRLTNGVINSMDFEQGASYLKWLLFSQTDTPMFSKLCAFSGVTLPSVAASDVAAFEFAFPSEIESADDDKTAIQITDIDSKKAYSLLCRSYAFEQSTRLPAKLSVSEIKGMKNNSTSKKVTFKKPRFMQNGVTGADRGNATHSFLQFCDFNNITDMASLEAEKARLTEYEFITKQDCELVDSDGILDFICSDLMQGLISLGTCRKEDRFIFTLPAHEVTDIPSDEPVVIQGIIDCWFEKDGKAVIVDYKTDRVSDQKTLISRYKVQLDMYERAIASIHSIPTSAKYIYSFCLKKFIKV